MTRMKPPSEGELRSMIGDAKRAIKDLNGDIRAALLNGAPTGGLRDQLADVRSRISGWENMLEEIAEQAAKVITDRVAAHRLQIGVSATARIAEVLAGLQPPPFPTAQIEGTPL